MGSVRCKGGAGGPNRGASVWAGPTFDKCRLRSWGPRSGGLVDELFPHRPVSNLLSFPSRDGFLFPFKKQIYLALAVKGRSARGIVRDFPWGDKIRGPKGPLC